MVPVYMAQVFISYKHVKPDEDLAASLGAFLKSRGWSVFLDTNIEVGMQWVKEIDHHLRTSQAFVVLLSKESIRSPMVRQEVKLAHELSIAGKLTILPVRLDFQGQLPYDLGSYLDPIRYADWSPNRPFNEICTQIYNAIEHSPPPVRREEQEASNEGLHLLAEVTDSCGAPLPAADVRLETGTLGLSSPFYVRRGIDHQVENLVLQEGSTIIVKGPRQVGKSSLLARALKHGKQNQAVVFYLDFQLVDAQHFETLGRLFRYLANRISHKLRTSFRPLDVWNELLGDKDSLTDFIERAVLDESEAPVIFAFDEADRVFRYDYRDDFFATLRGWHNNRAVSDQWRKLNIIVTHATDPILWIQDLHQSPFNVGERFRLGNFSAAEISELNSRHGSPLRTNVEIEELIQLVGGQPYLTRQALYWLSTGVGTRNELIRRATDESGPFGDHLRSRLWSLRNNDRLRRTIRIILRDGVCESENDFQSLLASGLIRGSSRFAVEMNCDLYRDYFKQHL
jgi:AAA-like domain/TIR domain